LLENNIDITPKQFTNLTFQISDFLEVSDDTGLVVGLGLVDFSSGSTLTQSIANALIQNVEDSITRVSNVLNDIGIFQTRLSNRELFVNQSIIGNSSTLSRITDTDFARESSIYLAGRIRQQVQLASLTQANFAPTSLLSLFS
jgi:flagellin